MKTNVALTLICAIAIPVIALALRTAPSVASQSPTEPPADLVKPIVPGNSAKAYQGDLLRAWYDWETVSKRITIKRRERQTAASPWSEQIQEDSTSYFVSDVRATCGASSAISSLFIAGVYPTGESCIERWNFVYPSAPAGQAAYVPIDQRRLPAVRKTELFRGSQYGHIRSLEPDPDGRFVLFLTYENPTLYRLPLGTGSISIELAQATVPALASARSVYIEQHATEGRQVHILQGTRWEADVAATRKIIILKDGNNDGVFDAPLLLSPTQWSQLGYDGPGIWLKFCP